MYFFDKFNKEIQILARSQPTGGSTTIGEFDGEAWYKQATVNPNGDEPVVVKIIPLIMYNRISSDNYNDTCYENMCMICENKPETTVTCWTEGE